MTTINDHEMEIQSKNLNRFIAKLYRIINSDEPTVRWVPGGQKFLILDPKKFSQTVLPKYFKHSKFTSFVRQLNFYGFHKKRIITSDLWNDENAEGANTALADLGDAVCFQHEFFQENQPKLLVRIRRTTKQSSAQAAAESLSLAKQMELEDLREKLREMKKQLDSSKDEFQIKLAAARAEIELDYLHRIRAIEVCYKDLVTMLLRNSSSNNNNKGASSSDFPLPKTEKFRFPTLSETTSAAFSRPPPVAPRSISNSSRGAVSPTRKNSAPRSILMAPTYTPRDYLVNQKLDTLSQQLQTPNGSQTRRTLYDELAATRPTRIHVDALVGAATKHLAKELDKNHTAANHRASLNEILRRNKQLLAHYSTGNAAA